MPSCPREGSVGPVTSSLGFVKWNKVLVSGKYLAICGGNSGFLSQD